MRRRWLLIGLATLILVVMVVANLKRSDGASREVRVESASVRRVEHWVRAPGLVQPLVSVDVSSNITGRVESLFVEEGQRVRKGQLLLVLDDTRFRSAVEQNRAMLEAARSQLKLAEAEMNLARQVLQRRRDLHKRGLLSSEDLDAAEADFRVREAQVESGHREVERLEAALKEAEKNLAETRFVSPLDGVVTSLNLEEGENVVIGTMNTPGTVILTVADLSEMEIEAYVSEADVIAVRKGQRAKVKIDAKPDSSLDAVVTSIGQSGKKASREQGAEFEVKARIERPPAWLRPGMSADVEILTARVDSALAVPIQALVAREEKKVREWELERKGLRGTDAGGAGSSETREAEEDLVEGVFVIEEGRARFRRVETGVRGDVYIQVLSGLDRGDRVITGPYKTLRHLEDGDRVKEKRRKED